MSSWENAIIIEAGVEGHEGRFVFARFGASWAHAGTSSLVPSGLLRDVEVVL